MDWIKFTLITLAWTLALCFPIGMSAQTTQQWLERKMSITDNPTSSVWYALGPLSIPPCAIWVNRDGSGIVITARDANYIDPNDDPLHHHPWNLVEEIKITVTNGEVKKQIFYAENRGMSERFNVKADEDVFGKYYADIAKQLPLEVQDLFYGEYGIGHRP